MALINLLDAFDADVENQVAQVKEHIRETRSLVGVIREERVERLRVRATRRKSIARGTLAADSEFWCSI
ncbi:hypothetical protein BT96DRAFT_918713 [Gymnopus androsaceus JB14]|uniref:Uncharacterized protein n=1 Tax=Gymnopus androsaceus JB14 TaxID=1447944 RepID=A0A6A4HV29_9AGAR|nr:hypothetical protein BT96DRAFT_918713 [Gymnopus androsaceus JB14]